MCLEHESFQNFINNVKCKNIQLKKQKQKSTRLKTILHIQKSVDKPNLKTSQI